jgi:hypothetical protein
MSTKSTRREVATPTWATWIGSFLVALLGAASTGFLSKGTATTTRLDFTLQHPWLPALGAFTLIAIFIVVFRAGLGRSVALSDMIVMGLGTCIFGWLVYLAGAFLMFIGLTRE